jgi:hypothetical protein
MELWRDLEARYSGQLPTLAEREVELRQRHILQEQYLAWCRVASAQALDALGNALEARVREFPWLASLPLTVAQPRPVSLRGETFSTLTARLWGASVEAYVRSNTESPPSIHLLRQWGGHRSPRMACLPGAWLKCEANGGFSFRRFDEAGSALDLEELTATVVGLLLGRAGHH